MADRIAPSAISAVLIMPRRREMPLPCTPILFMTVPISQSARPQMPQALVHATFETRVVPSALPANRHIHVPTVAVIMIPPMILRARINVLLSVIIIDKYWSYWMSLLSSGCLHRAPCVMMMFSRVKMATAITVAEAINA